MSVETLGTCLLQGHSRLTHKSQECIPEAACSSSYGRLGNQLYLLGALLNAAARQNLCYVVTDGAPAVQAVLKLPHVIEASTGKAVMVSASSVRCSVQCDSIKGCMQWREDNKFVIPEVMQGLIEADKQRLSCTPSSHPATGPDGVVMHIRSGDIIRTENWSGRYPQPPCSYYSKVAEAYEHVLIVTQADMKNPCIQFMRTHFPAKVEVRSSSINSDACSMIMAQNLALSYGSWGPALASLSSSLRNIHVPFGMDRGVKNDKWYQNVISEKGRRNVTQYLYTFPGFDMIWSSEQDRFAKMLQYPLSKIYTRIIPALSVAG